MQNQPETDIDTIEILRFEGVPENADELLQALFEGQGVLVDRGVGNAWAADAVASNAVVYQQPVLAWSPSTSQVLTAAFPSQITIH